ncbi:MAG: DUF3592 domain-containing protein [Pedobacter sp.]|nr:DUF3592 domain-containing protein [Pedobacter sp.]
MTLPRFIFFLVFFAIGAIPLYLGWRARRLADAVRRWPSVPGTLLECELVSSTDDDSPTLFHQVTVRYRYSVQGREFESSRVAFAYGATKDRAFHQAIHDRLKKSSTVPVYYDPQQPSLAALTADKDSTLWLFGLIWTGIISLLFLGALLGY